MNDLIQKIGYFEGELVKSRPYKYKLKLYRQYSFLLSTVYPEKAYEVILEGSKYSLAYDDEYEQKVMIVLQGICLIELNKYDLALSILLEVKDYFYENNKLDFYAKVLSNIAVIYFEIEYYNQAIYIWKDLISNYISPQDRAFRSLVMNNLISAYQNTFLYNDYSEIQLKEILKYYEDPNVEKDLCYGNALNNLAVSHRLSHNYKEAIEVSLDLLLFASLHHYEKLKYEINYNLFLCYQELNDEKKMIKYLLNALKLSKKSTSLYLKEDLYRSLYLYYKSKNEVNSAFEFLEKLYELNIFKKELRSSIDKVNNQFEFNYGDQKNGVYFQNHVKNNTFEWSRDIYLENIKGGIVKINIDSIISVISTNKFIKIYLPNKQASIYKKSLKDFVDLLNEKFQNNHLFFNTNLRKELVNLYWLSTFDKSTKKLYLNVLGNEFVYNITRTQLPKFKDFLIKK
jgi:hypothetical protein